MIECDEVDKLLLQLDQAVRECDRDRAIQLEREIARRLASRAAECNADERRLKGLMKQLAESKDTYRSPRIEAGTSTFSDGDTSPFHRTREHAATSTGGVDYPVWFATNRKALVDGQFGAERGERISRGRAVVHVPKSHRFGELGSSFWKRLLRGDDRLRVKDIAQLAFDNFYSELQSEIEAAKQAGDDPQALIFLHGYNVSFQEAAIRAAQIGFDLKVPGATAFFSWPSRGAATAYPIDEATIEASERPIADFLVEFSQKCGASKINLIAHSMGNRAVLRALQRIAADASSRAKFRLNQIILAAPDVDRDLFVDLSPLYRAYSNRTTLYVSGRDLPVHLSSKLHDAPRAGYFEPYTIVNGVETIAVPYFDVDLLGHSYFASAEALLHDIFQLMRYNESPAQRQRLSAIQRNGLAFWELAK